ncbi:hypothetical protein CXP39_01855 [Mesoplasma syrphidae]|uniref:Uncharacterized protein n=1 Tax=Mesoplasma syrphidae TaxID=225999 RepID=A0A2K9C940_9MOLU|nr:hypothetical protein [Mesoplasma syrphidae]AUF83535.1 hypothetical protein CXP39_01855 [Mesoplasma syrphidae]
MQIFEIITLVIFLGVPFLLMTQIEYKEFVLYKSDVNEKKFAYSAIASLLLSIGFILFLLFTIISFKADSNSKITVTIFLISSWLLFISNTLLIVKQAKKLLTFKTILLLTSLSTLPFITFFVIFYIGLKVEKNKSGI